MKAENRKNFNIATKLFDEENFKEALKIFLFLDSVESDNFEIQYYIGACYLNTKYEKTKGIPYLESAIDKGEKYLPPEVFKDLGGLYHADYQFNKAIKSFERYISIALNDDDRIEIAKRFIEICENAKIITKNKLKLDIKKLISDVNTNQSEINPHVSADESVMYFTRVEADNGSLFATDSIYKILYAENKADRWSTVGNIIIDSDKNYNDIDIAGISPDGNKMFLSVKISDDNRDLYVCHLMENRCKDIISLSSKINSNYFEGRASITPDGSEFYFSSSRPGGLGGKDLYKIKLLENGEWSNPVNLGPSINTKYDEDAPFIHPDGKTLYFSSMGHNTIGGYDIFVSNFNTIEQSWNQPLNLGYPINSTSNDIGFVLSADGNTGYFSSSQGNVTGYHDIYRVFINKPIPLTMVKGTITSGNPPEPADARIKVYDNATGERIKYIYDPIPETGKYLMIFPPGKNYKMIVEADGFLSRQIDIYVPNQTYFYELFQKIHLSSIKLSSSDNIIGEEIIVSNTFYDIYETSYNDSLFGKKTNQKDYSKLLALIEELIEKTDSIGLQKLDYYSEKILDSSSEETDRYEGKSYDDLLSMIENAIENTDSNILGSINENILFNERALDDHFYDNSSKGEGLIDMIIGNDTIKVLPEIITFDKSIDNDFNGLLNTDNKVIDNNVDEIDFRNSTPGNRRYIYKTDVYFDISDYMIDDSYYRSLDDIAKLLIDKENFGVEINGFTDSSGKDELNLLLSKSRARSVMEYLVSKKVSADKIVIQGFGESKSGNEKNETERKLNRKTEIRIFEIVNRN